MRINVFEVINQTNKHKAKIYNQCTYTKIAIKNSLLKYKKKYVLVNIRMIKLSLNELELIAQNRNMRGYKKKNLKRIWLRYLANQNQK